MSKHTSGTTPILVADTNVSGAWAQTLLHVLDHPGKEISPLVLSVTGFGGAPVSENADVRDALDAVLEVRGYPDIETVAFTIFPQRLWEIANHDRALLFRLYRDTYPRYRSMEPHKNGRGLYFERLTTSGPATHDGNQLEHIISEYRGRPGVRDSMLQASVFDPTRDHVRSAQLGFPCLQHVSFVPVANGGLVLNAFYATQQLFDKAYGNYLGLCQLGQFMAHEMGLTFTRFNCFVGVLKLERIGKQDAQLAPVIASARAHVLAANRAPAGALAVRT